MELFRKNYYKIIIKGSILQFSYNTALTLMLKIQTNLRGLMEFMGKCELNVFKCGLVRCREVLALKSLCVVTSVE